MEFGLLFFLRNAYVSVYHPPVFVMADLVWSGFYSDWRVPPPPGRTDGRSTSVMVVVVVVVC